MRKEKGDITQLKVTSKEARQLRTNGINHIDDLWSKIGADFDSGLNELVNNTGVGHERLMALLSARGVSEAEKKETSWLVRYWLEALLVLVSAVLLVDVMYAIVLVVKG